MRSIWKTPEKIKDILNSKNCLFCFDFDGTLAPITGHYNDTIILHENKDILTRLSKFPGATVSIVSGRELKDVKKRIGIKNIFYFGNHGMEVEGPGLRYTTFVPPEFKELIKIIELKLKPELEEHEGVSVENKKYTLSIHYRKAKYGDTKVIKRRIFDVMAPFIEDSKVSINYGKKVVEIKPPVCWNKGKAVFWLVEYLHGKTRTSGTYPVFIGDDITDEDAFRLLNKKGLCIRVGYKKNSFASCYLNDVKDVTRFIDHILMQRRSA